MKKNIIIICLTLLIMGCNTEKERVIDTTDPYLWLEDVEGADALDWVKSQNKITETRYAESEEFSSTYEELLKEFKSKGYGLYLNRPRNKILSEAIILR